jgi:hypothetical protein
VHLQAERCNFAEGGKGQRVKHAPRLIHRPRASLLNMMPASRPAARVQARVSLPEALATVLWSLFLPAVRLSG